MSEAAEQIWAWEYKGNAPWGLRQPDLSVVTNGAEYVRKDLFDAVKAENARLKSERLYIVGWNDGFEESKYQEEHGHPSDGDIAPQYQFTAAEMAAVKAERDNYKALYEAERDDELLNIARQAGYQDGVEERRKLEARVKALAEALVWCSGSSDFNEGGQARDGWLKLCAPLIESE